jgi:hypothetical protein
VSKSYRKKSNDIFTFPLRGLIYVGIIVAIVGMALAVLNLFSQLNYFSLGVDRVYRHIISAVESPSVSSYTNDVGDTSEVPSQSTSCDDYSDEDATLKPQKDSQTENLESSITYLERLYELQRSTISAEMLIFLYQFLSAILIGVGTTFVVKSGQNLNELKNQAKIVEKQYTEIENLAGKAQSKTKKWVKQVENRVYLQDIKSSVATAYTLINNCSILLSGNDVLINGVSTENSQEIVNFVTDGKYCDDGTYKESKIVFKIIKRFCDALDDVMCNIKDGNLRKKSKEIAESNDHKMEKPVSDKEYSDDNIYKESKIVFKIIKRFYDTLDDVMYKIIEGNLRKYSKDDKEYIFKYLEDIDISLKICSHQNSIIFPTKYIDYLSDKIASILAILKDENNIQKLRI